MNKNLFVKDFKNHANAHKYYTQHDTKHELNAQNTGICRILIDRGTDKLMFYTMHAHILHTISQQILVTDS